MDDVDLVVLLRGDARPTRNTVAQHRGVLREVMRSEIGSGGVAGPIVGGDRIEAGVAELTAAPDLGRRRHRVLAVAAAFVLVGGFGATAAWLRSRPASPRIHAGAGQGAACSLDSRVQLAIPAGYDGPVDGPSPDAGVLAAGQDAEHWTSDHGTIELRWSAATGDSQATAVTGPGLTGRVYGAMIGISRTAGQISLAAPSPGACASFRLEVFDRDHAHAVATFNALVLPLFA